MKPIAQVASRTLKWTQPSALGLTYELRADDEPIATLALRSVFGSFATGQGADGCWTFKRVGFWNPKVTVRACEGQEDLATFAHPTWIGGGTLTLKDGRTYRLTPNLWQTRLEFRDSSDHVLLCFRGSGFLHLSAELEIDPAAARLAELPWLAMLGWYLIIITHRETGAFTAAAAAG